MFESSRPSRSANTPRCCERTWSVDHTSRVLYHRGVCCKHALKNTPDPDEMKPFPPTRWGSSQALCSAAAWQLGASSTQHARRSPMRLRPAARTRWRHAHRFWLPRARPCGSLHSQPAPCGHACHAQMDPGASLREAVSRMREPLPPRSPLPLLPLLFRFFLSSLWPKPFGARVSNDCRVHPPARGCAPGHFMVCALTCRNAMSATLNERQRPPPGLRVAKTSHPLPLFERRVLQPAACSRTGRLGALVPCQFIRNGWLQPSGTGLFASQGKFKLGAGLACR